MNPASEADAKLRVMESKLAAARQAAAKSEQEARELTRQLRGVNGEVTITHRTH